MLIFHKKYFFAAVFLFLVELFIALYVKDKIIRPYGGDFVVVIFLYSLLKSFWRIPVIKAIILVLSFAFLIEIFQYLNLISTLGLKGNRIATVVLGNHFEWVDMLVYSLAGLTVYRIEQAGRILEAEPREA